MLDYKIIIAVATNCLDGKLFASGCDECGKLGHCGPGGECHLLPESGLCVHKTRKWEHRLLLMMKNSEL